MEKNDNLSENSTLTLKKKPRGKPFQKGVSANPSGRPKVPEDIKQAFRSASKEACETLIKIINNEMAKDSDRIRAAEVILDRGYGKPSQELQVETNTVPQVIITGDLLS